MIKLRILNIKEFLKTVNECTGSVYVIDSSGRKENMNRDYVVQRRIQEAYRGNKNMVVLSLDIPVPGDYFRIVNYYAGDC